MSIEWSIAYRSSQRFSLHEGVSHTNARAALSTFTIALDPGCPHPLFRHTIREPTVVSLAIEDGEATRTIGCGIHIEVSDEGAFRELMEEWDWYNATGSPKRRHEGEYSIICAVNYWIWTPASRQTAPNSPVNGAPLRFWR